MPDDVNQLPDAEPAMPPALSHDLSALDRTPAIPPCLDAAIRAHARQYFARQRRIRIGVRWASVAAAALVLLAISVWRLPSIQHQFAIGPKADSEPMAAPTTAHRPATAPATPSSTSSSAFAAGDINHDGVVDILDAFAVARGVKAGRALPVWDVNGDGVVDQRDVDLIAQHAVAVKGGAQ